MRFVSLFSILLSCAPNPIFCTTPCGVAVASWTDDVRGCDAYSRTESSLVSSIYSKYEYSCVALKGVIAWKMQGDKTHVGTLADGGELFYAGWAECSLRRFTFHDGDGGVIGLSAFAHEEVHIVQGCEAELPVDDGADEQHANWFRDGLFNAVDNAVKER